MIKRTSSLASIGFIIFIIVAISGLFYFNLKISSLEIGGDDFYIYWSATRALLVDGVSPYSETIYEKSPSPDEPGNLPENTERDLISIPLYASIITLPFSMIEDFITANAFWMTSQQISLGVLILMMLKITKWRPRLSIFSFLIFSLFFSYLAVPVLISGNMIVWTSLFFVLAIGALQAGRDEIAGGILALTTFQLHIIILCIVFILLWAVFQKRYIVVVWFFGLLILMTTLGIFLIADWPIQYLRIVIDAINNPSFSSFRAVLIDRWPGIGNQLSWILIIILSIVLVAEWWFARLNQFRWALWTICLTLVLSRFLGFPVLSLQNIILYIPLILVLSILHERWQKNGDYLNIIILIIFFFGGWLFVSDNVGLTNVFSIEGSLYLLPSFLLISLYWVRWWVIRDQRKYILEMHPHGED